MACRRPRFFLQWHVTARCDQRCAHCYITAGDLKREAAGELDGREGKRLIDQLGAMAGAWRLAARLLLSGGDPLLRPDLFDLMAHARGLGLPVGILGNPARVDDEVARDLARRGVDYYQLSLDGLEATHDRLRRPGSFQDTLRALSCLRKAGIFVNLMFTLSRENACELLDVACLAAAEGADSFTFARVVPIGQAARQPDWLLGAQEYRDLYARALGEFLRLEREGARTHWGRKDHLWVPLYEESGRLEGVKPRLAADPGRMLLGCGVGRNLLAVEADGAVVPCRRLPIPLGRAPRQTLAEMWLGPQLRRLRDASRYRKCGRCPVAPLCLGCPGVAAAASGGDPFAPDPQCWRQVPAGAPPVVPGRPPAPSPASVRFLGRMAARAMARSESWQFREVQGGVERVTLSPATLERRWREVVAFLAVEGAPQVEVGVLGDTPSWRGRMALGVSRAARRAGRAAAVHSAPATGRACPDPDRPPCALFPRCVHLGADGVLYPCPALEGQPGRSVGTLGLGTSPAAHFLAAPHLGEACAVRRGAVGA